MSNKKFKLSQVNVKRTINVTKTKLPALNAYIKYLKIIWKNNWITNNGELSVLLESKLKSFLGIKNLSLVNNGTTAMQIAFKALNLKGEVITTPFTFPATTNALIWQGLKPVFADIDRNTFNIDPKSVENRITKKTTAILGVHVFGNPCDVEVLEKIAKKYKIHLIYDSAHAFAVEYNGNSLFRYGEVNTLSFHASKIFHTIEGGAIISRDNKLDNQIKIIRNHGIKEFVGPIAVGVNAKMNEFEAAMGLCVLGLYEDERIKRKKIYDKYVEKFSNVLNVTLQHLHPNLTKYNYSYFPLVFNNQLMRDNIYDKLLKHKIYARKYYYNKSLKYRNYDIMNEVKYINDKLVNLPNASYVSHGVLCLPLFGDLNKIDILKIIELIKEELD